MTGPDAGGPPTAGADPVTPATGIGLADIRRAGAAPRPAVALHHTVTGPPGAPPLVLLGSLGSSLSMWQPQAELAGPFRVIRVDHRGHGGSPVPGGPYSVADLGRDVLALLDFLQLPAVSLVGLSLGGAVGQWLALHAPQRLERLVLLCTSARFGEPAGWLERAAAVRAAGTGAVADAVLGRWFTPAFARARPEVLAEMRTMITSTVAEGYAACCDALSRWDARADLPSVGTPTLVVSAGDDPSTPPEHGELLAAGIPGARFEVLAGAAHLANVEQPERVTALIGEHLGGRSG